MWAYSGLSDSGGCRGGQGSCDYIDTWYFDSASLTWTCTDTGGGCNYNQTSMVTPGIRAEGAMVYDPVNDVVVLFGSLLQGNITNDTWHYYPASNTWSQIYPNDSPGTPARRNADSIVYDSVDHKIVMFAGSSVNNGQQVLLNDVWLYDAGTRTWTNPRPANPPAAGKFPPLAYDSHRNLVIYYGGPGNTWGYSVPNNTWTNLQVQGGPVILVPNGTSMTYDESTDTLLMFGGAGSEVWKLKLR
jgi:hypothetical protein